MSNPDRTVGVASSTDGGRYRSLVANSLVAARFLPVWLATGVLVIVAAIIAPATLQHTSWAYVLPLMTILAIAALGQMLVIMQAGIDLSTPGVMTLGGLLVVGVSLGQDDRLALGRTRAGGSRLRGASGRSGARERATRSPTTAEDRSARRALARAAARARAVVGVRGLVAAGGDPAAARPDAVAEGAGRRPQRLGAAAACAARARGLAPPGAAGC